MKQLSMWPEEFAASPPCAWTSEGIIRPPPKAKVTVLNFSGGRQSSALAEMAIRGRLTPPDIVLTADPGMEHAATYDHIASMHERLNSAGIAAFIVPGPNLYNDLVNLKSSGKSRIDNPPYWVEKENGGRGRLLQKCTAVYKIAPMDRFLRKWMEENRGISQSSKRIGANVVEKWIGLAADEKRRISLPQQKYIFFRYPLIEAGITKEDCLDYLKTFNVPVPPPSVCVACFSNTSKHIRSMSEEDFSKVRKVDEAIRNLNQVGINGRVFVSKSMKPLSEIRDSAQGGDDEEEGCDSGYCFT